MDSVAAGVYSAVYTIGSLVGCLIAPFVAAKVGKTKPIMFTLALVAAIGGAFGWLTPNGVILGACLGITGVAIGGVMPLLMSIPVQLPEIGSMYAGTAGGVTATLQLLGAVVIPSYIIAPIAGNNMKVFFLLGGACMLIVFILNFALPEVGE